jgi:hypothetical protein
MRLLRFADLRGESDPSLKICRSWVTLNKYIDERGFPPGFMCGGFRTWTEISVRTWLENQAPAPKRPSGSDMRSARRAKQLKAEARASNAEGAR